MLTNKKPGKKIKYISSQLGDLYSICVIDLENVVYRELSNNYAFEISGIDNQKQSFNANLYIWDTINGKGVSARLIDKVFNISSLDDLKSILKSKVMEYQSVSRIS